MALKDKLDTSWASKEQAEAVFQFRATVQDCYMNMAQAVSKMDALIASTKFTTVDAEIKTEGAAVRKVINDAKALLDTHLIFINWKQPVV